MKRSKVLLVSFILGVLYAVYLLSYFSGVATTSIIGTFAAALITPHMLAVVLAVIFNGLGYFQSSRKFAIVGAILYAVAMVMYLPYLFFVILQMILSFVGASGLKETATI